PSSNAGVVSVSPGLAIGGGAAGVCATAPMLVISAAIKANFFIVAPLLPAAIKNVPDFPSLAVGNEDRAVRRLCDAIGPRQRLRRVYQRILPGESAGKDLELAGWFAARERLKGHVRRRLRQRCAIPRTMESDECPASIAGRELAARIEHDIDRRPVC